MSKIGLPDRLKELRKEHKMTQADLANKLGVVRTAVANYETDRTTPDNDSLQIMSKLFNVSTDYLLGLSNARNSNAQHQTTTSTSTDISDKLAQLKKELETEDSLMFDGAPATIEQVEAILNAIEMGKAYATQRAKEKFTRKDYRK